MPDYKADIKKFAQTYGKNYYLHRNHRFYVSLIPYTGFFMKDYRYYITLLKQFKSKFADKYGILKIGIFGSVVRGEQTEKSDLEKRCGCPIDLIRLRKS